MRFVTRAACAVLLTLAAYVSAGCSDKSTEPEDKPPASTPMKHVWSDNYGDAADQSGQGVAADDSGHVVVTGTFQGDLDFGKGAMTCAGDYDIFLAKLGSDGACIWNKRFGDAGYQDVIDVAVDHQGNVIVAGFFSGTVNFGGNLLTSAGGLDIYVAKFDPGGSHIWSKRFGAAQDQLAQSVAVDGSGNVIVTGYFSNTVNFGGNTLTSAGSSDIFVAEFGPGGDHIWSKRFGNSGEQGGCGVAADASGNVIVAGYFYGTIDFGGGARASAGDRDIFVAKFEPDGDHVWSERFGDASTQTAITVAVDGDSGDLVVAGYFQGSVDFSGSNPLTSAGSFDIFVAKLGSDGACVWSKRFGDAGVQNLQDAAIDAWGNVIITGWYFGTVDFGGGALTAGGPNNSVYVAKFGPGGAHIRSKSFGDGSGAVGRAVSVDPPGNLFVTGFFLGVINFGGGDLATAGSYDVFVAKFAK